MLEPLHIVIDSREQSPWAWNPSDAATEIAGLAIGDYSLASDTEIPNRKGVLRPVRFSVERKSLDDLLNSISTGWEHGSIRKFMNAPFAWRPLLAECDMQDLCFKQVGDEVFPPPHNHPKLRPSFVLRRLAELGSAGVSVYLCGDVQMAAGMALRIFRRRVEVRTVDAS